MTAFHIAQLNIGRARGPVDGPVMAEFMALLDPVNAVADETLGPEDLMPRLRIDADLTFRGITGGVASGVASLAPFGAGNPRPVFAARRVEIIDGPRKLKERHLKMSLKQDGRIFRAIAWRAAERHGYLAEHRSALDVGGVQRRQDLAARVDPLGDFRAQVPLDQRRRLLPREVVEPRHAQGADLQDITEALRRDQADACTLAFQDRVGGNGGAVPDLLDRVG